jgi:4-carboxymuconolactone decarboxylase
MSTKINIKREPLATRGDRFAPLTWEQLTPAQTQMAESVLAGRRASMQGPYNVLLRSPELGNLAQQFGEHTRFNSSMPLALNELAILMIARHWRSEFVWWAHQRMALDAGLAPEVIQSILAEQPLQSLAADVQAVFNFCQELIQLRRVSDASYAQLVAMFGEEGAVDLMAAMSYYTLVSMCLNVDRYPLPDGVKPNFQS